MARWPRVGRPVGRRPGGRLCGAALAAMLAAAIGAGGCSQLAELRQRRAEDSALEDVARRMRALERIEGGGRFEVQYGEAAFDLPFVMRLGRDGVLRVEAEISDGPWSRLGRLRLVSDATATEVYAEGGPAETAWADSLGPVLRPMLLSVFGGGDILVRWLLANRCEPVREARCCGLEVSLRLNRDRGSVERWTIRDPVGGVSFTGFIHSWSESGRFPRIVTGMVHPYGVGISVEFNEIGLALAAPDTAKTDGPGNFEGYLWFQ